MADHPLLELDAVTVLFAGVPALADLSLCVDPGEIVGVIGPNGAGKTTTLNVTSGFVAPAAGDVRLRGRSLRRVPPFVRARLGIGRTFQTPRLFPRLTLAQNLEITGRQRRETATQDVDGALALVGLATRRDAPVERLGSGERRFAELARALMLDPALLLLDEPATGLREREVDALAEIVRRVHAGTGVAALIVSHDMRLVDHLCTRVVVVDRGCTLTEGSPAEVRENDEVVRAYFGQEALA